MIAVLLIITATFIVEHNACVSSTDGTASIPSLDLLAVFRARREGVLKVDIGDTGVDWLRYYQLLPTTESVSNIGRLLFGAAIDIPRCHPGDKVALDLQNPLIALIRKQITSRTHYPFHFLAKYVIFKVLLFGKLSLAEAELLIYVFWNESMNKKSVNLERLIGNLASAGRYGDLFVLLAEDIDTAGVRDALLDLSTKCPSIIIKLVREYVEDAERAPIAISYPLFSCLNYEAKSELQRKCSIPLNCYSLTDLRNIQISRTLSELSSGYIADKWFREQPACSTREKMKQQGQENLLIRLVYFDPRMLPREVWIRILLCCDDWLFQIYAVPAVCKHWRDLHGALLTQSLIVQEQFVKDFEDDLTRPKVTACKYRPWDYFLGSPQALLRYLITCKKNDRVQEDQKIDQLLHVAWDTIMGGANENGLAIPSELYVGLYVHWCKTIKAIPVFYQPHGMSDEEYVAVMKRLISIYGIIPIIPRMFLKARCGMFAKMLTDNVDLMDTLFQGNTRHYDELAVYLFLTQSRIPPTIDAVLCEKSVAYRLLTNEDCAVEKYLDVMHSQDIIRGIDRDIMARNVIALCLVVVSESNLRLSALLEKDTPEHYTFEGRFSEDDFWGSYLEKLSWKRKLGSDVLTFLCDHCKDYSEEDFNAVVRVLEQDWLLGDHSKSHAARDCIYRLFNGPELTIELVQ